MIWYGERWVANEQKQKAENESSLAITAAAHLTPLVDYADLDGHLLIDNDPYEGVSVVNGKLMLPDRPGLSVQTRA